MFFCLRYICYSNKCKQNYAIFIHITTKESSLIHIYSNLIWIFWTFQIQNLIQSLTRIIHYIWMNQTSVAYLLCSKNELLIVNYIISCKKSSNASITNSSQKIPRVGRVAIYSKKLAYNSAWDVNFWWNWKKFRDDTWYRYDGHPVEYWGRLGHGARRRRFAGRSGAEFHSPAVDFTGTANQP